MQTKFDSDMMVKYRQLVFEKDSLLQINKVITEEKLQLGERLSLAETGMSYTDTLLSSLKKLEDENNDLMRINKALYNELMSSQTKDDKSVRSMTGSRARKARQNVP